MNKIMLTRIGLLLTVLVALSGCGGGGGGGGGGAPKSGSSGVGAPDSIIGYKLVQTVRDNDGKSGTISVGRTITYQFIDSETILGDGLHEVATTSWSYTKNRAQATVNLNYDAGRSRETLRFSTSTTGTYESNITFNSGSTNQHSGTFVVSRISGGTGGSGGAGGTGGSGDSGGGGGSCTTQLSVYTSIGDQGSIDVSIDGSYAGTLTQHYTSGAPTCGTSGGGIVTKTVSAGSHTVSADSAGSLTWPSRSYSVAECGCTQVHLR